MVASDLVNRIYRCNSSRGVVQTWTLIFTLKVSDNLGWMKSQSRWFDPDIYLVTNFICFGISTL